MVNKGMVIAGFAGIGKTTLAKKYKNVIDLESTIYKWDNTGFEHLTDEERKGLTRNQNPNWPQNYIYAIKKAQQEYDFVMVWIHPQEALPHYDANRIEYTLCFPRLEDEEIYRNRFIGRGNNENYVNKVAGSMNTRIPEFMTLPAPKIILQGNETLEDYLLNNNYNLIKKD